MNGNEKKLQFYRIQKTGNKIPRIRTVKGVVIEEMVDETKKVYYTKEAVDEFSLETMGVSLPHRNGYKTEVHNYIIQFWQHFLGPEVTMTFINYLSFSYNESIVFVSQEHMCDMMSISRASLKKYLDILEKYGFIVRFWAEDGKGMSSSTRIKIRQGVPFLSEEEIEKLPEWMKEKHDAFMKKLFESNEIVIPENNNHERSLKELERKGKKRVLYRGPITAPRDIMIEKKKKELNESRKEEDIKLWNEMCKILSVKMNEATFKTWYREAFCILEEDQVSIIAPTPFAAEWIESKHLPVIKDSYKETTGKENVDILVTSAEAYV